MTTTSENFLTAMLENYYFTESNFKAKDYFIQNFERLKPTVPFSNRLNNWIIEWYEKHKEIFFFTEEDDFDANDLNSNLIRYKEEFESTGKIRIWTGESKNSIFGDPLINVYFRCWHDYIHITYSLGFTFEMETIVASIQCSMLPPDYLFERELVMVEIVGQAQYHYVHRNFLVNQRQFTIDYLKCPLDAIFKKQIDKFL